MQFHPTMPYDVAFKAQLDGICPNVSEDLGRVAAQSEEVGERILEAILGRGCQAQNSRNIMLGREAAAELPRDWFVARVERVAASVLNLDDSWEYLRLLEMCAEIDVELLRRLVARGMVHGDEDIREAAGSFHDDGRTA